MSNDLRPRTVCDCYNCAVACKHMPGNCIPGDIELIAAAAGQSASSTWVLDHFVASEGALVSGPNGRFRIPTITPAQQSDRSCVFLSDAGKCTIHAISPYGCRAFDSHMLKPESDERSLAGLRVTQKAFQHNYPYAALHTLLVALGRTAPPLAERKAAVQAAWRHHGKSEEADGGTAPSTE